MLRAVQLYTFLEHCNESDLPKEILECGAGVWDPDVEPLFVRFANADYAVRGIEISEERASNALAYCKGHGIDVELAVADMRDLPFDDTSISHAFSYNAIFHLPKAGIAQAIDEIRRVLRPDGVCFINFAGSGDTRCGEGEEVGPGEFQQTEGDEKVQHSFFDHTEADALFDGFQIAHRERRTLDRLFEDGMYRQEYIDYIVTKA